MILDSDMVGEACRLPSQPICRANGRTPWDRVVGNRSEVAVAAFGEKVMLMTKGPRKERQWALGMWRGLVTRNHEVCNMAL